MRPKKSNPAVRRGAGPGSLDSKITSPVTLRKRVLEAGYDW